MLHDTAGAVVAVVLVAIGLLHVLWGYSPWPAKSRDELARFVFSRPGMPSRSACLVVGIGLLAAAYALFALIGVVPLIGPHWLYATGVWGLTVALLLRGFAGPLANRGAGRDFARWNLIAYSPLCAALGLCALVAATA